MEHDLFSLEYHDLMCNFLFIHLLRLEQWYFKKRIHSNGTVVHVQVTTLVPSGHIRAYTLCGALVAESPLYKDLRYPNPTLLARGLVLASTITSRTLLCEFSCQDDKLLWPSYC